MEIKGWDWIKVRIEPTWAGIETEVNQLQLQIRVTWVYVQPTPLWIENTEKL